MVYFGAVVGARISVLGLILIVIVVVFVVDQVTKVLVCSLLFCG